MVVRFVRLLASSRGMFAAAVAAGAFSGLGLAAGGGGGSHIVTAQFSNADGLVAGNDVRMGGIDVGTVQSINVRVDTATGRQYAQATFNVDSAHWPLHRGAEVAVKPKGVLSDVYVDVVPGSATGQSLGDAPFFALAQTQSPVNLDELSNIFDPSVRVSIRTQLQEGVLVFGGSGVSDLNQSIQQLNPLTADLVPVTGVLAQRTPELDRLNAEFDTVTADLAREDANLRGLLANGNTFLGVLAAHEVSLQGTLVHAAGTLASLDQALSGEENNLRTIFADGPTALKNAMVSANYLAPLIANVDPYIGDLDVLLHEFVTATGYNTGTGTSAFNTPLDTLRVDGSLPSAGRTATPCGGSSENPC